MDHLEPFNEVSRMKFDWFSVMQEEGHEAVHSFSDPESGLRALIGIHSTRLGPALGGCRMWPYGNAEEAFQDVLRLSKAMTYKAAMADLPLGGGKMVVMGGPAKNKTKALLTAIGRCVESLKGRYIIAEDVGITLQDMETIREATSYVTGRARDKGGSGDPSVMTAMGVLEGIRVCFEEVFGNPSPAGRIIVIQGVGKVGAHLAQLLHQEGAKLYLTDMDAPRLRSVAEPIGAMALPPEEVCAFPCDLYAPCALGGVLNDKTLERLRCQIIAGAANNQLERGDHGVELSRRGILYAPDYVINAGGLINIACEFDGYDADRARKRVLGIADTLRRVFVISRQEGISPHEASEKMVLARLRGSKPI
jgi:leucine dehydrogenase